jgi:hypothetical protein
MGRGASACHLWSRRHYYAALAVYTVKCQNSTAFRSKATIYKNILILFYLHGLTIKLVALEKLLFF